MIRLVVFDFDGTLVDSNGVKESCMHTVAARVHGGLEALSAARALGGNRYSIFTELVRRTDLSGDPAHIAARGRELAETYSRLCVRGIVPAPERRGTLATLRALKRRGVRVWINSATPERNLPELLRRRGLMPYLHGALGGPRSKAGNLRKAMASERVTARETLMIGDGPDDLAAAREIGTWFVAITAEMRIAEQVPHRMRDLTTLMPLIDCLHPRPVQRA
jgi:phosphoglycolate phosphatase